MSFKILCLPLLPPHPGDPLTVGCRTLSLAGGRGRVCPELEGEGGFWDPSPVQREVKRIKWKPRQHGALMPHGAQAPLGGGTAGQTPTGPRQSAASCPAFYSSLFLLHSLPSSLFNSFPPTSSYIRTQTVPISKWPARADFCVFAHKVVA